MNSSRSPLFWNGRLNELRSFVEVRANGLSQHQRLIACALIMDTPGVSDPLLAALIAGLGYSRKPELISPVRIAIREIYLFARSGVFQEDDLMGSISLLRALGQLDDVHLAIQFVSSLSLALESCAEISESSRNNGGAVAG